MPTKQEIFQNYYALPEPELIAFIQTETFSPDELSGIFSFHAYNNKTEVVKAFLAKCKPTQAELDMCFSNQILNPEILNDLLPLHPSPETLGQYIYQICSNFQMHSETLEGIEPFSDDVKKGNLATIERLMEAGAILQDYQNYDAAKVCFVNNRKDLFEKYFDKPEAQKWHLQFCCRPGNEKLKSYLLAKKIDYNSLDGIALLNGAMVDDKELFFKTLPLVDDLNILLDPYSSLLDSAISTDDLDIVKAIIAKGGKPNFNGKNISIQAINSKDEQLPKLLIETFDLDFRMNNDECLVAACNFQKIEIAKILLEKGADVHAQKNACLKIATKNKNTELITILKQFGANDLDIAPYKFNCDVATANFETLWKEWLIYYKKFFPSAEKSVINADDHKFIETPVSLDEILACETKIKMQLNDELKTIYKHCTQGEYLFFGMLLYRPSMIASSWHGWVDLGFIGLVENDQNYSMFPEGTIQKQYTNAKWLPFCSDMTSNHISIDYDPAEKGKMGQIINSGRDQWERYVLANNITELARKVMKRVEANEVEITPDGNFNLIPEGGYGSLYDVLPLIKQGKW
jgi:cell wall assembly regulator SMI1/ankyrin repeat protein